MGSSPISISPVLSNLQRRYILGRIQSDLRSPSSISNLQRRHLRPDSVRSPISISNLQSPISIRGPGGGGGLKPSRRCAMDSFTMQKDLHPLFAPFCAISSRPTRSLGAFGAKSESPPLSQDLKRLHAPTRDLRLLSSIYTGEDLPPPILQSTAALGRRFATYEISKRHLRSTVQGSSDVAQRCPCMTRASGWE